MDTRILGCRSKVTDGLSVGIRNPELESRAVGRRTVLKVVQRQAEEPIKMLVKIRQDGATKNIEVNEKNESRFEFGLRRTASRHVRLDS